MLGLGDIAYYDERTRDVVIVAIAGFCLIMTVFVIIIIWDTTHRLMELIFLFTGAILNILSGILNLVTYCNSSSGRSSNSLILVIMCLTAGVLMLVDAILQIKK